MKSFDPIDILFMTLIIFYLIVLVFFIIIFVKLSKSYDDDGNKIGKENDALITEMNQYSNKFVIWSKKTFNKIVNYFDNLKNKKMKTDKTINEVNTDKEKITVVKEDKADNVSTTKKTNNATKNTNTKSTTKKKASSSKEKTNSNNTKKNTNAKKSTANTKKNTTTKKTTNSSTKSSTKKSTPSTKKSSTNNKQKKASTKK